MEKPAAGPTWMTVIKHTRPKGLWTLLQTDGAHVEPRRIQIGKEKKTQSGHISMVHKLLPSLLKRKKKKTCSVPFQLPTLLQAQPFFFFQRAFNRLYYLKSHPDAQRQFARIAAVKYSFQCSAVGTNGLSFIAALFFLFIILIYLFFTIWWLLSSCQTRHQPSLQPNGREHHECCRGAPAQLRVHRCALQPLQLRPNYAAIILKWYIFAPAASSEIKKKINSTQKVTRMMQKEKQKVHPLLLFVPLFKKSALKQRVKSAVFPRRVRVRLFHHNPRPKQMQMWKCKRVKDIRSTGAKFCWCDRWMERNDRSQVSIIKMLKQCNLQNLLVLSPASCSTTKQQIK